MSETKRERPKFDPAMAIVGTVLGIGAFAAFVALEPAAPAEKERRKRNGGEDGPRVGLWALTGLAAAAAGIAGYAIWTRSSEPVAALPPAEDDGQASLPEADLEEPDEGQVDEGGSDEPPVTGEAPAPEPELGPRGRAGQIYAQNRTALERALREWLDEAAAQKGIVGGWAGPEVPPQYQQMQALVPVGATPPDRGPDVWNQAEAWWAATNAYAEVLPEADQFDSMDAWAANVGPQVMNADAFVLGRLMRRAMEFTQAQTVPVGSMNVDWGLF